MSAYPIRDRRKKATRIFKWKVALLAVLIAGIAYSAWLAPWARARHTASVEITR